MGPTNLWGLGGGDGGPGVILVREEGVVRLRMSVMFARFPAINREMSFMSEKLLSRTKNTSEMTHFYFPVDLCVCNGGNETIWLKEILQMTH